MRIFTPEAAEQVISLLCYARTEDTYNFGHPVKNKAAGAYRLAVIVNQHGNRLTLSDRYDPLSCRTITVASALQKNLLEPTWEDLAAKLYLNDQDILYVCLMSHEEPVCLRLIEAERIIAYRNRHNDGEAAKIFTYMPGRPGKNMRLKHGKAKHNSSGPVRRGRNPYRKKYAA